MSSFPEELRRLAVAKGRAQAAFETVSAVYHAAPPDNRADETIARAIACKQSADADMAFDAALKAYMESERK